MQQNSAEHKENSWQVNEAFLKLANNRAPVCRKGLTGGCASITTGLVITRRSLYMPAATRTSSASPPLVPCSSAAAMLRKPPGPAPHYKMV